MIIIMLHVSSTSITISHHLKALLYMLYIVSYCTVNLPCRSAGWIMDYGFYGFKIHKIHNPWILKWIWNGLPKSIIHKKSMDYAFYMDFKHKSIWIMDFFYGYGFKILKNMILEWIWILFSNPKMYFQR